VQMTSSRSDVAFHQCKLQRQKPAAASTPVPQAFTDM